MKKMTMDGNAAVSYISYALSELAVIYPISPSSPMAELADEWSANEKPNLFGKIPRVVQMQSEGGAAGALHGALTCGALTTTYTCSQGLLLMLPNMYKIAGELLPTVIHVSARALSTHALNIFGDHQDVMACRQSGFAMLCSSSVQETMDFALLSHLTAWRSSLPFLHFFDGFRTSHEVAKIDGLEEEEIRTLLDLKDIERFRARALTPDMPQQRGTAQNPDVYFQNREAANAHYLTLPDHLQHFFDKFSELTGRTYRLFDYFGAPDATHVLVLMGSAGATAEETVAHLQAQGKKVGLIKVRLYRPFHGKAFCEALPATVLHVSVLDRTKEAGSLGEPLYLDVLAALQEQGRTHVRVQGGRYGLGGKEFTPAHCVSVFENGESNSPKNHFTVGIKEDVTHTSLPSSFYANPTEHTCCKFYGLGSDGTVGANKNSIQIIGEHTPLFVQGYFCYDSRKSGGVTISHLRYGKTPILSAYLIDRADFVACHNPSYLERYDMLSDLKEGGTFLLNCPWTTLEDLENELPISVKQSIARKRARFFVVDAAKIVADIGLGNRISTLMQAAFFYLAKPLPFAQAKELLKEEISRKFSKKGDTMVEMNARCVDFAEGNILSVPYPETWENAEQGAPLLSRSDDEYFQKFILPVLSLRGDELPVSVFHADGSVPTNTARLEKHGAPPSLPKWIPENCIQCNQCAFVCPHACIRPYAIPTDAELPDDFRTLPAVGIPNAKFRIQVSPHDCMGCGVCARTCPTKEKALVMTPATELLPLEGGHWEVSQNAPRAGTERFARNSVKGSQFYPPLFEFSYACSGCGETPYIKLLTQLFGERLLIANATGCSSIYGGSAPVCPYAVNAEGHGPAWASSLFEDTAEFGYGMRLANENAEKSVWIIGGDGFAYDIGYGGLDHVLASGANVNILVLDSEVYSNTGGQASKATPLGAVARFAAKGNARRKKDLGLMAMGYKQVYVAQVCMGANKAQLINAFTEAEAYEGVSIILAYSPCIAHGVYLGKCMEEEKLAVDSGYWHLYRYHPSHGLTLDSKPTSTPLLEFLKGENRFAQLLRRNPERAETLFAQMQADSEEKYRLLQAIQNFLAQEKMRLP